MRVGSNVKLELTSSIHLTQLFKSVSTSTSTFASLAKNSFVWSPGKKLHHGQNSANLVSVNPKFYDIQSG